MIKIKNTIKTHKILLVFFMLVMLSLAVSSERLPVVNSDLDNWGNILNNFLRLSHTENGSINATTDAIFNQNVQISTLNVTDANTNATFQGDVKIIGTLFGGSPLKVSGGLNVISGDLIFSDGTKQATSSATGVFNSSAWSKTGTDIILSQINNNVGIGTTSPATKLEVNGFTKLGSDAPKIKYKKFSGTMVSGAGQTSFNSGINALRVLDISCRLTKTNVVMNFVGSTSTATAFNIQMNGASVFITSL